MKNRNRCLVSAAAAGLTVALLAAGNGLFGWKSLTFSSALFEAERSASGGFVPASAEIFLLTGDVSGKWAESLAALFDAGPLSLRAEREVTVEWEMSRGERVELTRTVKVEGWDREFAVVVIPVDVDFADRAYRFRIDVFAWPETGGDPYAMTFRRRIFTREVNFAGSKANVLCIFNAGRAVFVTLDVSVTIGGPV